MRNDQKNPRPRQARGAGRSPVVSFGSLYSHFSLARILCEKRAQGSTIRCWAHGGGKRARSQDVRRVLSARRVGASHMEASVAKSEVVNRLLKVRRVGAGHMVEAIGARSEGVRKHSRLGESVHCTWRQALRGARL